MKRRKFLKEIGLKASLIGVPTIIPASALGLGGKVAPSERINMGVIGLGTQGTSNTRNFSGDKRVQIAALCDTNNAEGISEYGYKHNGKLGLRNARRLFGMDIPHFTNFREMLSEMPGLDVLSIAVPDHSHAAVYLEGIKAGKDIFGEKPLTRTIGEGKILRDAVLRSGRIWQTGSWQRSLPNFIHAAEIVRNGYLGKISRIKIGLPANFPAYEVSPQPVPEGFDFEMWQGVAPRTFYHPHRVFTTWRGISMYSSGKISDWGAHHLDIALWALDMSEKGPLEIRPEHVVWPKGGYSDQPLEFSVVFSYPGGLEIEMSNLNQNGVEFFGTKGRKMFISRKTMFSSPIGIASAKISPSKDTRLYPIRGGNHFSAFIDSILDRRATSTDIRDAHRSNTGCLLGEIAYRIGRPIKWDPQKEEIIEDEEARRMCDRFSYSAPWKLA